MSRFYASLQGSRGPATRQGTADSGITAHPRGWSTGILVTGDTSYDDATRDQFEVRCTGGSNGTGPGFPLVTVREIGGNKVEVRYFKPDGSTLQVLEVARGSLNFVDPRAFAQS